MQEKAADSGAQRAAHFFRCRTDLGIFVGAAERRWALLMNRYGRYYEVVPVPQLQQLNVTSYEGVMGR